MPTVSLEFADGFYQGDSGEIINKRAVNVYPIIPQADAISQRALISTSGVLELDSVSQPNSRGVLVFSDGTEYRVIGTSLYSVDAGGNLSASLGTIGGTADVSMASNGINIAIVNPTGSSYFYTPSTSTLETITDAAFLSFGQVTGVAFKDGYYVFTTDSLFFSGSVKTNNDGKSFNALDFADAEIDPDKIIFPFVDHNQLYILGDHTTQVYDTIQTAGFPFQVIRNAMITKGCSARNCVIPFNNSFLFLGGGKNERPSIYQALGSSIQRISTRSIDRIINSFSEETIAAARAFSYSEDGNYFAVFTIGDRTFVYDQATSVLSGKPEWHERQTGITNGVGNKAWRCIHGVLAHGEIRVADDRSGKIGKLDKSTATEYGSTREYLWSTKPFTANGDYIFSRSVELGMETGLGNDLVEDPQIRMDYSDNGSKSFGSELSLSLGEVGEYNKYIKWRRLGRIPSSRTLRWKVAEPVLLKVYGLWVNAEVTANG